MSIRVAIICECGIHVGMGHYSRSQRIMELFDKKKTLIDFYVINKDISTALQKATPIKSISDVTIDYNYTIIDIMSIVPKLKNKNLGKIITLGQEVKNNPQISVNIVAAYGTYKNKKIQHDNTTHYLGMGYAVLDNDYLTTPLIKPPQSSLLITFGGTDPNKLTLRLLDCHSRKIRTYYKKVTIVIGIANKEREEIIRRCIKNNFDYIINTNNMMTLLDSHESIICSPGVTLYEAWSRNRHPYFIEQNKTQKKDFEKFPGRILSIEKITWPLPIENLSLLIDISIVGQLLKPLIFRSVHE